MWQAGKKTIDSKFIRRSIDSCIRLSNMFSSLQDEDVSLEMIDNGDAVLEHMFLIGKRNIFRSNSKWKEQKQEEKRSKKKSDSLEIFLVTNRYSLLEDNPEFEMERLMWRNKILITSKKKLKKCKFCNFKKRSCLLDPEQCKAIHSQCFKCSKKGHFPASINCQTHKKFKGKRLKNQVFIYYFSNKNK